MKRDIKITENDLERLKALIRNEREFGALKDSKKLKDLEQELNRAIIITPENIPSDTITMNSTFVLINLDSGQEETYSLVYPEDADFLDNRISVFAPIGTAMLGFKVGNEIDWEVPGGVVKYRIKEMLYQPESRGDFES